MCCLLHFNAMSSIPVDSLGLRWPPLSFPLREKRVSSLCKQSEKVINAIDEGQRRGRGFDGIDKRGKLLLAIVSLSNLKPGTSI